MAIGEFYYLVDDCIVVTSEWHGPQRVALDKIHNTTVSTVFLGIEHIGGMFETIIHKGVEIVQRQVVGSFDVRHAADCKTEVRSRKSAVTCWEPLPCACTYPLAPP